MTDEPVTAALAELAPDFRGELLRPGDGGYDAARRVWNGMIDRRPGLIARCTGVGDVQAAIRVAREQRLLVAVRGGGHNVAGNAVCDDGLVIDLSPLKGIFVDPSSRTARVQGGVTLGELDRETQRFGLATTGGLISTTGVAGLTLGGGLGWLARKFGTACDNLLSAQVVTPAGEIVTASESENPDLFWGLRGGGGNFGIVTTFEYRLHRVGPEVLAGAVFHPLERGEAVLRFFHDFAREAPDELTAIAQVFTAGPAPFLPPETEGRRLVAIGVCWAGDLDEGERVLAPLRSSGSPLADVIGPIPYTALQSGSDPAFPAGRHNYWKSSYLNEISDGAIAAALEYAERMPSPHSVFYVEHLEGAIGRVSPEETAFAHRDAAFDFNALAVWEDPSDTDENVAWARGFWEAMQPHAGRGVYVNNLGVEGQDRVREAYGEATYARLAALKDRFDPENLLRLNQNVEPSRAGAVA
jgi:hypothetical protein